MKKIFFVALVAALCVASVDAKKKDKKEDAQPKTEAAVVLKSSSDSLSYAGGYANTNGLIPFLQQQYRVDTAYMADFIQGLKDAKEKANDPRFIAYSAGAQIQQMLEQRMISGLKTALQDAPDSLDINLFYAGFFAALNNDSTLFKQETGMGIASYIRKKRMEAACNMLRYSDIPYAEIAQILAFSSQSHFIQVFKADTGMTPHEYRNSASAE